MWKMIRGYGSSLRLREFTREFQDDGTTSAHVHGGRGKESQAKPARGAQSSTAPTSKLEVPRWGLLQ